MESARESKPVILQAQDQGRRYGMGRVIAIFKADEAETDARYSVSEWILEPGFEGVGPHSHDTNDELFYVVDGKPEILVGRCWTAAGRGTFVRIPAGVTHDFRNRHSAVARLLNIFIPGGFERQMPSIVSRFEEQSAGELR